MMMFVVDFDGAMMLMMLLLLSTCFLMMMKLIVVIVVDVDDNVDAIVAVFVDDVNAC